MSVIWDIISIAVIAICIYLGVKKGLLRSIVDIFCYILAFIVARYTGPLLAQKSYDNFLEQRITNTIASSITTAIESGAVSGADIVAKFPLWLEAIVKNFYPDFSQKAMNVILEAVTPEKAQEVAVTIANTIQGVVVEFVGWILILIIFLVVLFILKKIAKVFNVVNKIPLVGSLNMVLGGLTGIGIGIVMVVIVGALGAIIGILLGGDVELFNMEHINNSFIMGTLKRILIK